MARRSHTQEQRDREIVGNLHDVYWHDPTAVTRTWRESSEFRALARVLTHGGGEANIRPGGWSEPRFVDLVSWGGRRTRISPRLRAALDATRAEPESAEEAARLNREVEAASAEQDALLHRQVEEESIGQAEEVRAYLAYRDKGLWWAIAWGCIRYMPIRWIVSAAAVAAGLTWLTGRF